MKTYKYFPTGLNDYVWTDVSDNLTKYYGDDSLQQKGRRNNHAEKRHHGKVHENKGVEP